jgi:hypothetical protein
VFERYTERARRSIFFARYEASVLGSTSITCEALLLGILREDKAVAMQLGSGALESILRELAKYAPPKEKGIATSVDMPLNQEMRRALTYAAEEAERLNHKLIDAAHLALGLLRVEDSLAAKLLRKHGIEIEAYRNTVGQELAEGPAVVRAAVSFEPHQPGPVRPPATSLEPTISGLRQLVGNTAARLREFAALYGDQRLKRKPWTRKEALGHLIDWAIAHQHWLTRALTEPRLTAAGYPDEAAVAVEHYADFGWVETVDLWVALNGLLVHVLLRVPEEKLSVQCRIGIAEPVPLSKLMETYLAHYDDIVGQILARLD